MPHVSEHAIARQIDETGFPAVVVGGAGISEVLLQRDLVGEASRRFGARAERIVARRWLPRERCGLTQDGDGVVDLLFAVERVSRPLAGEVAPLRELPRRVAQPLDRPVVAAEGGAPQRPAHALGRIRQLLLEPSAERIVEQPRRRRLGEHFEQRIDARLDRPLAQQVGAEAVNGADVRFFQRLSAPHRAGDAVRRRSCDRRAFAIEPLAQSQLQFAGGLLRERDGDDLVDRRSRPSARMRTIRPTSSVVFPVPAAASTTSVSSRAVAIRWRASASACPPGLGQAS